MTACAPPEAAEPAQDRKGIIVPGQLRPMKVAIPKGLINPHAKQWPERARILDPNNLPQNKMTIGPAVVLQESPPPRDISTTTTGRINMSTPEKPRALSTMWAQGIPTVAAPSSAQKKRDQEIAEVQDKLGNALMWRDLNETPRVTINPGDAVALRLVPEKDIRGTILSAHPRVPNFFCVYWPALDDKAGMYRLYFHVSLLRTIDTLVEHQLCA